MTEPVFEVIMPVLGMAQDTGRLIAWGKAVGDAVCADDVLMEVETDKTVAEVPAGYDGFVAELRAAVGDDVPVGEVVAVLTREKTEGKARPPQEQKTSPPQEQKTPTKPITDMPPVRPAQVRPEAGDKILASPKLKRLMHEAGHSLDELVKLGAEQPLHVKDFTENISRLSRGQGGLAQTETQIEAQVATQAQAAFIKRLTDATGAEVTAQNLWLAFAARGWRECLSLESVWINLMDASGQSVAGYQNPDRGGLTQQTAQEPAERPSLILRDLSDGFITKIPPSAGGIPQLCLYQRGETLTLTLSFDESVISTPQAVQFINTFCQDISNPLLGLC